MILMRAALVDSDSIVRLSSMHGSQHVNQHPYGSPLDSSLSGTG